MERSLTLHIDLFPVNCLQTSSGGPLQPLIQIVTGCNSWDMKLTTYLYLMLRLECVEIRYVSRKIVFSSHPARPF